MNYSEIVEAVKAYSDRRDAEVANNMDTFILMAESSINKILRIKEMTQRAEINTITDQEYYPLPPDFSGLRDIEFRESGVSCVYAYISPEQMNRVRGRTNITTENYYTLIASQLHIYPTKESGGALEIVYYQKVTHLDSSNTSNWVSTDYPDLYLASIMSEVEAFVKNPEGVKLWSQRFKESASTLSSADQVDRWSGTPLQIRVG